MVGGPSNIDVRLLPNTLQVDRFRCEENITVGIGELCDGMSVNGRVPRG